MEEKSIEGRLKRLKKRDELVIERFPALGAEQYKGKKKFTNEAILAMLSDEFPPLSEACIGKIVFGRVEYRSGGK